MSNDRQLVSGAPVPEDDSHKTINPATGMQRDYVVLSAAERAKGFIKPVRCSYVHAAPSENDRAVGCGGSTTMSTSIAETYARLPNFYFGTYCANCHAHFPLNQFVWTDGEPMDPVLQPAWAEKQIELRRAAKKARIATLENELAKLKGELE